MTMFLKKTWGFSDPCGPLVFSREGARDNARRVVGEGELVVIVGTKGDETAEREQGMVLGLMEPSKLPVSASSYDFGTNAKLYDEQGRFKWPFGLELRRAWRFDEPWTTFADICDRYHGREGALSLASIEDDEERQILSLPKTEVRLLQPARVSARITGKARTGQNAAPPPSTTRRGVMHLRRAPAFTYAMRLRGAERSAYKIGWAFDWEVRNRNFNRYALPSLGGIRYEIKFTELWDTAMSAFKMEQKILNHYTSNRHPDNSEVLVGVADVDLENQWRNAVMALRRRVE